MKRYDRPHWMNRITLALFMSGLVAGLLKYDGLAIFLAIIIFGDLVTGLIAQLGKEKGENPIR